MLAPPSPALAGWLGAWDSSGTSLLPARWAVPCSLWRLGRDSAQPMETGLPGRPCHYLPAGSTAGAASGGWRELRLRLVHGYAK